MEYLRFTRRDQLTSYQDRWLWIPKTDPHAHLIPMACTIQSINGILPLWVDAGSHYRIPRHFSYPGDIVAKETVAYPQSFLDHTRISPRNDKQAEAWDVFSRANNGILNLACGKGKTVLALKRIAYEGTPGCVILGTLNLIEQWKDEAQEKLGLSSKDIGIIPNPKRDESHWQRPLVLISMSYLAKHSHDIPLSVLDRFGIVVFDECHHLSAPYFLRTAHLFSGKRFGLTATPEREDGTELIYQMHLGPIFYSDMEQEVKAKIIFQQLPTRFTPEEREKVSIRGQFSFPLFCSYLGQIEERNSVIRKHIEKALAAGRKILVLGHSVEGLQNIASGLPDGDKYEVVYEKVKPRRRKEVIVEQNPAFATLQIAREALSVPAIDTVFFATPFKAWGWLLQGVGRAQRPADKKSVIGVIFEDRYISQARRLCDKLKYLLQADKSFQYETITG